MSQDSSKKAYEFLTSMGVDVQFGKMVTDYKDHKVMMKDGQEIPTRTFLWVSGVKAQPITGIDGDHLGRGFRIVVDEFNRIPGMDGLLPSATSASRPPIQLILAVIHSWLK